MGNLLAGRFTKRKPTTTTTDPLPTTRTFPEKPLSPQETTTKADDTSVSYQKEEVPVEDIQKTEVLAKEDVESKDDPDARFKLADQLAKPISSKMDNKQDVIPEFVDVKSARDKAVPYSCDFEDEPPKRSKKRSSDKCKRECEGSDSESEEDTPVPCKAKRSEPCDEDSKIERTPSKHPRPPPCPVVHTPGEVVSSLAKGLDKVGPGKPPGGTMIGDYPAEYNAKVHGPYDPARYYGKPDTPFGQVKIGDLASWFARRNKHPQAGIALISRAYWRWQHKYMLPQKTGLAPILQAVSASMLVMYLLNHFKIKNHYYYKYH